MVKRKLFGTASKPKELYVLLLVPLESSKQQQAIQSLATDRPQAQAVRGELLCLHGRDLNLLLFADSYVDTVADTTA